jgi:nitroreductase
VHFEAGAIGQRLYVAAEALGLGATGIGAFYDDEVHDYLNLTPEGQVVYISRSVTRFPIRALRHEVAMVGILVPGDTIRRPKDISLRAVNHTSETASRAPTTSNEWP